MITLRKVIRGKRLSDVNLSVHAHIVVDNTLNDKAFALARTMTVKVYTALAAYDKAMLKSKEGTSTALTFEKNTARKTLESALTAERQAINLYYAGNTELMLTSGFELNQVERGRIEINQPATGLIVEGSQPTKVNWSCDNIKKTQVIVRYRIVDSGNTYQKTFSNKNAGIIYNLESGKKYEFEAVLISHRVQGDTQAYNWSQEKVWIVQ